MTRNPRQEAPVQGTLTGVPLSLETRRTGFDIHPQACPALLFSELAAAARHILDLAPPTSTDKAADEHGRLALADALRGAGEHADAERIERCGDGVMVLACADAHPVVVRSSCRHRLCPDCARNRSQKAAEAMEARVAELTKRGLRVVHLTLTAPNIKGELRKGDLAKLVGQCAKLRRRKALRDNVAGWARAIEVTYNVADQSWHPHVHCLLVLRDGFIPYGDFWRDVTLAWHNITGCGFRRCPVKLASMGEELGEGEGCCEGGSTHLGKVMDPSRDAKGVRDACQELCKYVSKGSDLRPPGVIDEWNGELVAQLARSIKGRQLSQLYGAFRGLDPELPPAVCTCCVEANKAQEAAIRRAGGGVEELCAAQWKDPELMYLGSPADVWWRATHDGFALHKKVLRAMRRQAPWLWGAGPAPPPSYDR